MRRSRKASLLASVISLAAFVIMVGALWPRSDTVPTKAQRADHIASRIRCPFCNGESIAEATSQVARDLHLVIEDQVAGGMTDDEVYEYFAARYGEGLLLSPPLLGWGLALWVLPLLGLAFGAGVIMRRRRSPAAAAPRVGGSMVAAQVNAQLEAAERDRTEIAQQLVDGELDEASASALSSIVEREAEVLSSALAQAAPDEAEAAPTPRLRRAIAGTLVVVAAAGVITVTLLLTSSGEGPAEGIVAAPPIDFASLTSDRLEEVVAANPDVVPMRVALGTLLLDEGEIVRAAEHFTEALNRDAQHPEALAAMGWISYLAGQHETAEMLLMNALTVVPRYPQAQWWLANVRLLGLGDPAGARGPLESLLAAPDIPDDVRALAEEMLRSSAGQS